MKLNATKTKVYFGPPVKTQVLLEKKREKKRPFSIQLYQIGRPLIRLIEIQMIFKFCAYIKCVNADGLQSKNRGYRTSKDASKNKQEQSQEQKAYKSETNVRATAPKWIYILKIVIKWMWFGCEEYGKSDSDSVLFLYYKVHQLSDVNATQSRTLRSLSSSSSNHRIVNNLTWLNVHKIRCVCMMKSISAYNR